jgi:hypothetical protein
VSTPPPGFRGGRRPATDAAGLLNSAAAQIVASMEGELLDAAIDVARDAPMRHGPTTSHALIYWPKVERLRAAIEAMGLEWRAP